LHLSGRVQSSVIDGIVVSLGQELDRSVFLFVQLQYPVHNGDVSAFNLISQLAVAPRVKLTHLEDDDLAHSDILALVVGQEEQVAPARGKISGVRLLDVVKAKFSFEVTC